MKLEQGKFCPLIGEDCLGLKCSWFTQIRGNYPQTGESVDEWGCAVTWMPLLLIENSQKQRETGAAVESFRNESTKNTQEVTKVMLQAQEIVPAILEGALNNKCSLSELKEVFFQITIYCGVPTGNECFKKASELFNQKKININKVLK